MQFEIGQIFGDYEVAGLIGSGGMGTVYRVRHLISDRQEAMKVILPDLRTSPELADRFLREIKIQASLSHPNIASLYNAQRAGDEFLMFMELVEGTSLYDRLRQGPVDRDEAVHYIVQVLSALGYAHDHGIVHRDIKPRNILLTRDGRVKLTDFGIARSSNDKQITKTGAAVGSLYYMSPEQVKGEPGDARSDVYSTGVMLYELAAGKRPFEGDSDYAIMAAHMLHTPVPPILVNPSLTASLSRAIMKSLEKDPASRFQTAHEFRAALEARDDTQTARMGEAHAAVQSGGPWDPAFLDRVRKDFAAYIGPMARILVDRIARRAQTVDELYRLLAAEIPTAGHREKFLSSRAQASGRDNR